MAQSDSTNAEQMEVARPTVTGTRHLLAFEKLDAQSFERLCLWLVGEEGFQRVEHYGHAGADGGRDVLGYRPSGSGDDLWFFQCKRTPRLTPKELIDEIAKVRRRATTIASIPRGIVFVASCAISARTRDAVRLKATESGLACEFWAVTELDRLVKKYPSIIEEFFQQPAGQTLRARADQLLKTVVEAARAGKHSEMACGQLEEAVRLAVEAHDHDLERRARRSAARSLGEFVVAIRPDEPERQSILARIDGHVALLGHLGEKPHRVVLERAMAARLRDDPIVTMALAEEAVSAARSQGDELDLADALVVHLHACWQLDELDEALGLEKDVEDTLRRLTDDDPRLVLWATWLGTLCRASRATLPLLNEFYDAVRGSLGGERWGRDRAAQILGQLAADFNRANALRESLQLCEWGYEVVEPGGAASQCMSVALQAIEIAAELDDEGTARRYLDIAVSWARRVHGGDLRSALDPEHLTAQALTLFTKGRALLRLAGHATDPSERATLVDEATVALHDARSLAVEHRTRLQGDLDLFVADVSWWLGRAAREADRFEDAITCFRAIRQSPAMRHPRFGADVGVHAWFMEAELLAFVGKIDEAGAVLDDLRRDPRASGVSRIKEFGDFLEHRLRPVPVWFDSPEAVAIADKARLGLRDAIADQNAVLVDWWREWHGQDSGPESELLDFWGRGGFARVAAAVRARPHEAIAVDACSVAEIRQLCRLLCPLFDTVIVKWKGPIESGMVLVPMDVKYGGPGSFGGHGYMVAAGLDYRQGVEKPWGDWTLAMGWANPIPRQVTAFLAEEALDLLAAGRLVVLPAPLVGCTQTATGWTDELLVDGFLGGVVNAVRHQPVHRVEVSPGKRLLDLSEHSLPYMRDVSLGDLARVLDESDDWLRPLRAVVFDSLRGDALRSERWETRTVIENQVAEACRALEAGLRTISHGKWQVTSSSAGVAVELTATGAAPGQREPVTDLLRSLVGERRELTPWVPFWRLSTVGGRLDWTCPIDNPSRPNTQADPSSRTLHSWLYPGTGGWTVPVMIVPK